MMNLSHARTLAGGDVLLPSLVRLESVAAGAALPIPPNVVVMADVMPAHVLLPQAWRPPWQAQKTQELMTSHPNLHGLRAGRAG